MQNWNLRDGNLRHKRGRKCRAGKCETGKWGSIFQSRIFSRPIHDAKVSGNTKLAPDVVQPKIIERAKGLRASDFSIYRTFRDMHIRDCPSLSSVTFLESSNSIIVFAETVI